MMSRVVQPYHGQHSGDCPAHLPPSSFTQLLPWGPGVRSIPGKRVVKHVLGALDLYALGLQGRVVVFLRLTV